MLKREYDRYNNLDILKLICAFLVVCIHVDFARGSDGIRVIARIAVPIFFMITGFFYDTAGLDIKKQKRQIVKSCKLVLVANVLYFLWGCFISLLDSTTSPIQYLASVFTTNSLLEFVVFNESPFEIHLWYLNALVYTLLIATVLSKYRAFEKAYYFIPVLMLLNLALGSYSTLFFGKDLYYLYARNFVFMGLPWFLLGSYFGSKKELLYHKLYRLRSGLIVIGIVLVVFSYAEKSLLTTYDIDGQGDLYIGTILLAADIFLLAIMFENGKASILAKVGRLTATFIYIAHLGAKDVLAILVPKILPFATVVYEEYKPIWVFLASLVAALLFETLKKYYSKLIVRIKPDRKQ